MELIPLAAGLLFFIIGTVCLKKQRGYKAWLVLAILCFIAALLIGGLRLLDGMTIGYPVK